MSGHLIVYFWFLLLLEESEDEFSFKESSKAVDVEEFLRPPVI
jgi:hypothetical protein